MGSKRFLHDKLILLLISLNSFFVLLSLVSVLLRLGGGKTGAYIVQYRSNLGLSAYQSGDSADLLAFVIFGGLIFSLCLFISVRVYSERRYLATTILALCLLLLVLSVRVSNALLVSR